MAKRNKKSEGGEANPGAGTPTGPLAVGPGTPPRVYPVELIDPAEIDAGENHRLPRAGDAEEIERLAIAFRSGGQQTPIRVHTVPGVSTAKGKRPYTLGFGWRRLQAAIAAGVKVKAEVCPWTTFEEIEREKAIENIDRQNLNPAEEVVIVSRLLALHDGDRKHVAARLGRSESWVTGRAYLVRLDPAVMGLVADGRLPLAHAREIAKVGDAETQRFLAGWTIGDGRWETRDAGEARTFGGRASTGSVSIQGLERLREQIASHTRSLKVVGWKLELPIAVKPVRGAASGGSDARTELPPCVGCEHNSKTDPVLFDAPSRGEKDAGVCHNAACFERKQAAVQAEKDKAAAAAEASLRRRTDAAVKQAKAGRETVLPEADVKAAVEKAAGFVKPESVARHVKKAIEPVEAAERARLVATTTDPAPGAAPGKSRGPGTAPATPGAGQVKTEKQVRHEAYVKWDEALKKWWADCFNEITSQLAGDGLAMAALMLLTHTEAWDGVADKYRLKAWDAASVAPLEDAGLTPELREAIALARKRDLASIEALGHLAAWGEVGQLNFVDTTPELPLAIAEAFDVKIDAPPAFESFLPAELRKGAAA